MAKKTCAFCKCRKNEDEMGYVKKFGKHRTYYCSEEHYRLATERKKKREENKRLRKGLTIQN